MKELDDIDIAIIDILIHTIKYHINDDRVIITYSEFCRLLNCMRNIDINEHTILPIHLGRVNEYFIEKGLKVFISGIVVNKETQIPGEGFFTLLKEHGIKDELLQYEEVIKAQQFKDYDLLYRLVYGKEAKYE